MRVLLVEDNLLNQELARDLLEMYGHVVVVADSSRALRALVARSVAPDVVLMDVLLPDGDGVALMRELRAIPRFTGIATVAVTAHARAEDQADLLAAGFDGVITKPIDTRTFVGEVEGYAGGGLMRSAGGEDSNRR